MYNSSELIKPLSVFSEYVDFSQIKNVMIKDVKNLSFSGKILYINYVYLLIFIFLIL